MERRLSGNSDSSIEPMDISSSNKTVSSTEANSSLAIKTSNESDNIDTDENDEYHNEEDTNLILRREHMTQLIDNMLRKKLLKENNILNNNNNNILNNNNYNKKSLDSTSTTTTTTTTATTTTTNNNNNNNNSYDTTSLQSGNCNNNNNNNNNDIKYVCPICDKISTTQHEFTAHIRNHNNLSSDDLQNFTCCICSKVLSSASSLDRHVLVHTGERPFTCKYCTLTFTTNGNMHRHMRTHKQHEQHRENYESDVSTDSNGSAGSGRSNNNNNYPDKHIDGKRKSSDDDIQYNHRRKIRSINNNNNISNLNNNINNNNNISNNNNNHIGANNVIQKFCCPVCVRNDFASMVSLENHMDKEHPTLQAKCRHCEVVFKSHKALNAHRCGNSNKGMNVTQGFKDLTFVDFSSEKFPIIAKTVCEQSIRTPITNQKFECPKCYRAFPCDAAAEIHIKDCMNGSIGGSSPRDFSVMKRDRNNSETSEEDVKRDDFFANLDLQNKSLNTSGGTIGTTDSYSTTSSIDRPYTYSKMPNFDIKQELRDTPLYQQQMQQDTKDLADIQSIINVTSSPAFMRQLDKPIYDRDNPHLKYEEEAQDAFTAEFRKMKLRGEFPCRLCTAVFPNLRALKGHNRIHLSAAGPGPYRCNMCPYFINDKATLIRHLRTHNGDRPYECMLCNYAFTTKANCERHLRNRHGKTTRDEVKKAIIYHPSEDSSCDDPVKKMHMFSSPDFDNEDDHPNDRSTPVSHLREMLMPDTPGKIQVKSLDKLKKPSSEHERSATETTNENAPIDLSMSKKMNSYEDNSEDEEEDEDDGDENEGDGGHLGGSHHDENGDDEDEDENEERSPKMPNIDLAMFEKNQQLFMAHQLLSELPKMDPAHYFQLMQLQRFGFPSHGFPIHPLFLQGSFGANAMAEMKNLFQKDALPLPQMAGGSLVLNPFVSPAQSPTTANSTISPAANVQMQQQLPQTPTSTKMSQSPSSHHKLSSPGHQNLHHHLHHQSQESPIKIKPQPMPPQSPSQNSGPVKMVIKNGVLMPKQKQRRYRTERPFACEHCSARFTLRSNMERHIKQQHPQYWAQRQRGNQSLMRRNSGVSSANQSNSANASASSTPVHSGTPVAGPMQNSPGFTGLISDQVKYAILAQQLKARDSPSMVSQNSNVSMLLNNNNHHPINHSNHNDNSSMMNSLNDDDEPQLVIDEEFQAEDLSKSSDHSFEDRNYVAKKIAKDILEQAKKTSSSTMTAANSAPSSPPASAQQQPPLSQLQQQLQQKQHPTAADIIKDFDKKVNTKPELEKYLEEGRYSNKSFKEENDLVSVSKLVDNATNVLSFGNYFRAEQQNNDHSDEEGLVASGSASESNNSGTDEASSTPIQQKKKSAYSLAPNRVACPYCQRVFPWSSSLRRHILTHTGQKPFKCSHCPLLFTTKSNCDRHLLRKHGNVESAMSLPVPIDDIPEPKIEPVAREEVKPIMPTFNLAAALQIPNLKPDINANIVNTELPFKCHLCDGSFTDRVSCLEHIKTIHTQEFTLLMTKVTLEAESEVHNGSPDDEDVGAETKGKYPDYANRKVICAFCLRRFWSTEDLRRHMRTHSGERPFQCDICFRKFTLKHSMLRHRKKHQHNNNNQINHANANSASDLSDDESSSMVVRSIQKIHEQQPQENDASSQHHQPQLQQQLRQQLQQHQQQQAKKEVSSQNPQKQQNIENKINKIWKMDVNERIKQEFLKMENKDEEDGSDLIGNLLGISDQGILDKVLSSADEAAKLLGVDK